jgi:hypothetical protein
VLRNPHGPDFLSKAILSPTTIWFCRAEDRTLISLNVRPVMRDLLHRCWHEDPHKRPGWPEILRILDSAYWPYGDWKLDQPVARVTLRNPEP